jgi:hypothetical protein
MGIEGISEKEAEKKRKKKVAGSRIKYYKEELHNL